jgi:hypothetical protein
MMPSGSADFGKLDVQFSYIVNGSTVAALVDPTRRAILARLERGTLRRKPSSNFEQQLLQDRLFEIIEAD